MPQIGLLDSQDNVPFSDEFQLGLSQFIQVRGNIWENTWDNNWITRG